MKVSKLKLNPDNPRVIKDDKFTKLCQSITEFPKMMEIRPMVVDSEYMVLGGNQRLKAIKELGMKDVPDTWVKQFKDLTEEEKKEFIIKDNIGYGSWEYNDLSENWDQTDLEHWGVDLFWTGSELNTMNEDDLDLEEEFDPVGIAKDVQRVVFIFDTQEEAESYLNNLGVKFKKKNMAWQVNLSTKYAE